MFHSMNFQAETPVALEAAGPAAPQARPPHRRALWFGFGGAALAASLAFAWLAAPPACT